VPRAKQQEQVGASRTQQDEAEVLMSASERLVKIADSLLGERLLARQRKRDAGVIVLYHRVSPTPDAAYPPLHPEQFEVHCALLRRSFSVLPLGEFVQRQSSGRSLSGCCAITFDDGYLDFVEHALPVLKRHALPATHFLVLQSVRDGRPNWNWRANRLAEVGRERGAPSPYEVLTSSSSMDMVAHLGRWEPARRDDWLGEAEAALAPLPPEPPMMRAQDLARCDTSLISWGSHTVSHAMLGWCAESALRHEIEEAHQGIGEVTGREVEFLSYPNSSFSDTVMQTVREAGHVAALAVEQRAVTSADPVFALPRFDIGWLGAARLRLELSGATQALRERRGRASSWNEQNGGAGAG
jgi:peptidoglycan/xylan/chitin deacetylase (PgdA/CDA1 family)